MPTDRQRATPPDEFGVDFLNWVRRVTERAWVVLEDPLVADINWRWRRGTRWSGGLDELTIRALEHRYGVRFPPDHRLFLRTLHSTTPWMHADRFVDGDQPWDPACPGWPPTEPYDLPGFYDWLHDESQIREAMADVAHVMRELPFDDQAWQTTWLHRDPKPSLIPIFGHRYVVADDTQWILSVVEQDAILYATDLRGYLLIELEDLLR